MGSAPLLAADHSAEVPSSLRLPLPAAASGEHLRIPCAGLIPKGILAPQFPQRSAGAEVPLPHAAETHPGDGA
jgi:hypothetical protein